MIYYENINECVKRYIDFILDGGGGEEVVSRWCFEWFEGGRR